MKNIINYLKQLKSNSEHYNLTNEDIQRIDQALSELEKVEKDLDYPRKIKIVLGLKIVGEILKSWFLN